jgi:hypothetical protein
MRFLTSDGDQFVPGATFDPLEPGALQVFQQLLRRGTDSDVIRSLRNGKLAVGFKDRPACVGR